MNGAIIGVAACSREGERESSHVTQDAGVPDMTRSSGSGRCTVTTDCPSPQDGVTCLNCESRRRKRVLSRLTGYADGDVPGSRGRVTSKANEGKSRKNDAEGAPDRLNHFEGDSMLEGRRGCTILMG